MGFLQGNMGMGGSKDRGLSLPGSGTKFSTPQLTRLNSYFTDLIDIAVNLTDTDEDSVMVLIERLIQRLICGVGILDERFASKFLVSLEPQRFRGKPDRSLSYLVRLDALSQPSVYPEIEETSCQVEEATPQGFARVRPTGPTASAWSEFVSPNGFLRRDKVQERFVELLALSAAKSNLVTRPSEVDESRLCACPAKVVDADTLPYLLQTPPSQQVFLTSGDSSNTRFPDPRKFRIAIVEGCSCIRLRVGLMYASEGLETDIEVTLVLGIGFTSWPGSAHYPSRISLCHIDCLLHHQAALTGFFVVPAGPHPSVRCEDKSTLWQIRFPGAEQTLIKHYAEESTPGRALRALRAAIAELRAASGSAHVVSDYMLKTLFFWRLEEEGVSVPATMRSWTHDCLASHVLTILDRLVTALRQQKLQSYFFPWFNVMVHCPGGGNLHYTEEDYSRDASILACYLGRLSEASWAGHTELDPWARTEAALVAKWADVLSDLTPPAPNRTSRLSFSNISNQGVTGGYSSLAASQYSLRQLDYISHLLRAVLNVRSSLLTKANGLPVWTQPFSRESTSECEDLIFLLSTILEQAKNLTLTPEKVATKTIRRSLRRSKSKSKSIETFERSVCLFLEEIRNTKQSLDSTDDASVVREVLKWLYLALDKDRKIIGAVLRPYLSRLFSVSHENCWHMTEWKKRQNTDELQALGKFATLVLESKVTVNDAILDAYNKGWCWAESILKASKQLPGGVELIFAPQPGKVRRHKINPNLEIKSDQTSTRSLGRQPQARYKVSNTPTGTIRPPKPLKDSLQSRLECSKKEVSLPLSHCVLRNNSPVSLCSEARHRYASHRGLGTLVHALLNLRKFTILQEISTLLPEAERSQILDDIQRISKELRRPRRAYHTVSSKRDIATYRSKYSGIDGCSIVEEISKTGTIGSNVLSTVASNSFVNLGNFSTGTLMDTCRAARRRAPTAQVTNPSFFEPPEPAGPWFGSVTNVNREMVHVRQSTKRSNSRRSNLITKL